jgi:hypothetical protein
MRRSTAALVISTVAACGSFGSAPDPAPPSTTSDGGGGAGPTDAAADSPSGDADASSNVSFACGSSTCGGDQLCCATSAVSEAKCTSLTDCNGPGEKKVSCDDSSDCPAQQHCCIFFAPSSKTVLQVACAATCDVPDTDTLQACVPGDPLSCRADQSCDPLNEVHGSDLGLDMHACK